MTIKPEVLAEFDEWMDFILAEYPSGQKNWQTIRAELLAMDAEIDRLHSGLAKHVDRVCELSSRLAAADALLRDIKEWDVLRSLNPKREETLFAIPFELRTRITTHLSEPRT